MNGDVRVCSLASCPKRPDLPLVQKVWGRHSTIANFQRRTGTCPTGRRSRSASSFMANGLNANGGRRPFAQVVVDNSCRESISEKWTHTPEPYGADERREDGSIHSAFKREYAVDLDTRVVVAADPSGRHGNARPEPGRSAEEPRRCESYASQRPGGRQRVSLARWPKRARRRALEDSHRRPETRQRLFVVAWRDAARTAVCANRNRLKSGVGKQAMPSAAKWSSAASPMFLIGAACAAHGCAVARTPTSAI